MLVTFRSKAANITMFGDVAVALLRMMGQTGVMPGALVARDVPAALERLKSAVSASQSPGDPHAAASDAEAEAAQAVPVSLRQRAWPLIQLLEAAAKREYDVIWQQEGASPPA